MFFKVRLFKLFNMLVVLSCIGIMLAGCSGNKEADFSISTQEEGFSEEESVSGNTTESIYVYITGCVEKPGVYKVNNGTRIFEAVELAGGLTDEAYMEAINMALPLSDGQCVHAMSKEEFFESGNLEDEEPDDGKININTASEEQLMTLPGVGQSKAAAIVAYRSEHGDFKKIDDIMQVSGIKEACYSNIKELIKI